jgi:cell division septal protein FtsQ
MRERFMRYPEIKDVTFRRRLFHRLDCYLKEREPVALVASGRLWEVDNEGVIIPRTDDCPQIDLPVISGLARNDLTSDEGRERIGKALEVLELLKMFGFSPAQRLSEIHIEEEEVMLVLMSSGTLIRMGAREFPEKVKKLKAVYRSLADQDREPELIDLRFDRQVIVR